MAALNKVLLMGNLTRDPELRYTPGGAAVTDLGLAVNREYTNREGQRVKDVCYIDISTWGATAENCSKYLTKGSPIFIEGRLQLDTWENKQGEKRSKLKVVADRVQFLGSPRGDRTPTGAETVANTDSGPDPEPQPQDEPANDVPF